MNGGGVCKRSAALLLSFSLFSCLLNESKSSRNPAELSISHYLGGSDLEYGYHYHSYLVVRSASRIEIAEYGYAMLDGFPADSTFMQLSRSVFDYAIQDGVFTFQYVADGFIYDGYGLTQADLDAMPVAPHPVKNAVLKNFIKDITNTSFFMNPSVDSAGGFKEFVKVGQPETVYPATEQGPKALPPFQAFIDVPDSVGFKDTVALKGGSSKGFSGQTYSWKLPGSTVFTRSSRDTFFIAPMHPDSLIVVLQVSAQNGEIAFDTAAVRVVPTDPVVSLGSDSIVNYGATVPLRGKAVDKGNITGFYWRFPGGAGYTAASADTSFIAPFGNDTLPFQFRAVNEYHRSAEDTMTLYSAQLFRNFSAGSLAARIYDDAVGMNAAVVNNKLWQVISGGNGTTPTKEVWNSDDGLTWNLVTASPGFNGYFGQSVTAFNNKLYVIGGTYQPACCYSATTAEVWSSVNGAAWTLETRTPGFCGRNGHKTAVFKNRLYVIGGNCPDQNYGSHLKNDVWSTADGVNWTLVKDSAAFTPTTSHTVAVFNDKLWLCGTYEKGAFDCWNSADGIAWNKVQANQSYRSSYALLGLNLLSHGNKLWMLYEDPDYNGGGYFSWYSDDGANWTQALPSPLRRNDAIPQSWPQYLGNSASVVFNGQIFLLGLHGNNWHWKSGD